MVFSSLIFMFFYLTVTLALYFLCPLRVRNLFLLAANLLFYGWGEPIYVSIMLLSTMIDYVHGALIDKYRANDRLARFFVASSVFFNLGLLFFFKYWDFFAQYLGLPILGLSLPLGISFYTFQTMSYSIDVYRGEAERQHSIVAFGTYVTLFPQLIAGPIVRYQTVAKELTDRHTTRSDFAEGARIFTVGLCKKVLLANNIGMLWDTLKVTPELTVVGAWMGAVAFSFQIYFDFAGYSDMAIGLGRMLGFHFPKNFDYPYISRSITEFWRRWHITLGTWFREYVYIPLGGSHVSKGRQAFNIFVVWALTGFWHGADWNFLIWGIYFAVLLILEKMFLYRWLERMPAAVGHIYTLLIVVVSMAIFGTPGAFMQYLSVMFGGAAFFDGVTGYYLRSYALPLIVLALASTPLPKMLFERIPEKVRAPMTSVLMVLGLLASTAYLVDATYNPFLYFRF